MFDYSNYHIPPMMKKKGLAKRKMQAEKRLGKSLKVPMVKRTVPADDALAAVVEAIAAMEDAEAAAVSSVTMDEKCDSWEECNDAGDCWIEEKCWYEDAPAEDCVYWEECDEDGNCWGQEECWYDDDDWQEKAGDWLMDAVISYGFDPDVAEEWLEGKQETWAEIEARQREEKANQLAQDVSELADEATKIFENMLDDLTSRFPDLTDMLSDELNGLAEDALDEISRAQN